MSFKSCPAVVLAVTAVCLSGCAFRAPWSKGEKAPPPRAAAAPAPPPAAGGKARFSANTTMGVLLDTPETRAVLMRHVPGVVKSPQIGMARGLSLKQLAGFAKAGISPATLAAIDADLAKIN